tara:strand:+ start:289 stop:528 length:240 start_codon:yes stop_codon:yes gene_type:complete
MSSIYKEQDYTQTIIVDDSKIVNFLNEFRELLDKHNVKLYTTSCELYINNLGFVGMLEDNIETIEIVDGDEVLYTSKVK